jgi:hypothetical protein
VIAESVASGRRLPPSYLDELSIAELIERYWLYAKGYYRQANGTPTSEQYPIRSALRELNQLYGCTNATNFGPLALDCGPERDD